MNPSKTVRFAALVASICITFTMIIAIADYSYPEQGMHLASAGCTKNAGKV